MSLAGQMYLFSIQLEFTPSKFKFLMEFPVIGPWEWKWIVWWQKEYQIVTLITAMRISVLSAILQTLYWLIQILFLYRFVLTNKLATVLYTTNLGQCAKTCVAIAIASTFPPIKCVDTPISNCN